MRNRRLPLRLRNYISASIGCRRTNIEKRKLLRTRCIATQPYVRSIVAACFITAIISGCRSRNSSTDDIYVRQRISPQPVHVGKETVAIQLVNASAQPITQAGIIVEGDMTHPGMAPVFTTASETIPGSYQAHIDFNMSGDWVLILHIKLPDGRSLEREMEVKGVQSN